MQGTEQERFRITTWPGAGASVPPVKVLDVQLVDGQWLEYSPPGRAVALPEELYLRQALDVDVDDPEAIAAFVATYGRLDVPVKRAHGEYWSLLPYDDAGVALRAAVANRARELGRGESWDYRHFSHVEEVRAHLRELRNCVSIWDEYTRSDGMPDIERLAWEGSDRPANAPSAIDRLTDALSAGLRPFQLHLEWSSGEHGMVQPLTVASPNVYSAMCLQLFNHIVENTGYHECANETCGRRFVRQQGRAQYGQHRTMNVSFCSASCAKAQMQREYRRREKNKEAAR